MTNSASLTSCYLVEWYQAGPAAVSVDDAVAQLNDAAAAGDRDRRTALVMALAVPDDQTFFGVFTADDVEAVVQTCQRAGWPADRISADVSAWPPREGRLRLPAAGAAVEAGA